MFAHWITRNYRHGDRTAKPEHSSVGVVGYLGIPRKSQEVYGYILRIDHRNGDEGVTGFDNYRHRYRIRVLHILKLGCLDTGLHGSIINRTVLCESQLQPAPESGGIIDYRPISTSPAPAHYTRPKGVTRLMEKEGKGGDGTEGTTIKNRMKIDRIEMQPV